LLAVAAAADGVVVPAPVVLVAEVLLLHLVGVLMELLVHQELVEEVVVVRDRDMVHSHVVEATVVPAS
jgi:hypothetical protein